MYHLIKDNLEKVNKHGFGREEVKGRYKYIGDYVRSAKCGKGVYISLGDGISGDQVYDGQFEKGYINGIGYVTHKDDVFLKEFVNDRLNGDGTRINANGTMYKGNFENDDKQGK
mmetsp:Transcript_13350/g.11848  ORF Transcript_13350/g.11848 Transcript_13350/m.11848 type:complete len:114 (+) Transcript_13350:628-969(+)